MKVLIVASEPDQGFIGEGLKEIGFTTSNIITIDDGRQVIRCLLQFPSVNLIITGFRMLGANGLEVTREVKKFVKPPWVVIIVPWAEREIARPVAEAVKVDALLYYPFEAMALRGVIEETANRPPRRILWA